jgi:HPt (histidine-containing phosphotransfer) domain-containing protein
MDPRPTVDPARLRDLQADYGDLADQLLGLFEASVAATLTELRAALEAGGHDEVRRLAHRLKGSACNVGATELAELAAALEHRPPDAPVAFARLEAALEPTRVGLRAALARA